MNEKLEALKPHLQALTFAQVATVMTKPDALHSYNVGDVTKTPADADFHGVWSGMRYAERERSRPIYSYYYGFAHVSGAAFHFRGYDHSYPLTSYCGLGIETPQRSGTPPLRGTWIAGTIMPNAEKPGFHAWVKCSEAERIFTEFLLAGKTTFSEEDYYKLRTNRATWEGVGTDRLAKMARILLAGDLDYFLRLRVRHGGKTVDHQVFDICNEFDQDLWREYETKARAQCTAPSLRFSDLIPAS